MTAVATLAGVELRRFLRDRSNLAFTFVFPLVLVLLLGQQFGTDGGDSQVAVSGVPSALQERLVEVLTDHRVEVSLTDPDAARDRVARGRADAAVLVGSDAARAYDDTEPFDLEVVYGNQVTTPLAAQRIATTAQAISIEQAQVHALAQAGLEAAAIPGVVDEASRVVEPAELEVVDLDEVAQELEGAGEFGVGASQQLLLFVFLISLTGAVTLIQARSLGVVSRTASAPISTAQMITGQALGRLVIAGMQAIYIMVASSVLFGVRWGNLALAVLVVLVFCAVSAVAAMIIGSVVDNENAATGIGVGAGLVIAGLGGAMVPLESFSDTMRTVARITPHAWAYDALAEIQRRDGTLTDILPSLGVLALMALVLGAVGTVLLRRSMSRAI